jgi:hypothetical protein
MREHYLKNANYHIHTDPWYTTRWLLDVGGSASIWVGALLYNVSCFEGAYKVRFEVGFAVAVPLYAARRGSSFAGERSMHACDG